MSVVLTGPRRTYLLPALLGDASPDGSLIEPSHQRSYHGAVIRSPSAKRLASCWRPLRVA